MSRRLQLVDPTEAQSPHQHCHGQPGTSRATSTAMGSLAPAGPGAARGSSASCCGDICSSFPPAPGRGQAVGRAALSAQNPQIVLDPCQSQTKPELSPFWFAPLFQLGQSVHSKLHLCWMNTLHSTPLISSQA